MLYISFLRGILGYFVLLFRFAESKCDGDLPKWIAIYFWSVSLKEKDKKSSLLPPMPQLIPAIVLELCVVEMLYSIERLFFSSSPSLAAFFFFPLK